MAGNAGQVQKNVLLELQEVGSLEPTNLADKLPRYNEQGHGIAEVRDTETFAKRRSEVLVCNLPALKDGVAVGTLVSNGAYTRKASKIVCGTHVQLHFLSVGEPGTAIINPTHETPLLPW